MTADEGGFQRPHSFWGQKEEFFVPGQQYEVGLELPFWIAYKDGVYAGMPVQLNQGSRIVATGIVKLLEKPGTGSSEQIQCTNVFKAVME
jgi:hypothetical protein